MIDNDYVHKTIRTHAIHEYHERPPGRPGTPERLE